MPPVSASFDTLQDVHRTLFPDQRMTEMLFNESPVMGLINKDLNLGVESKKISLQTGRPQGRSFNFAKAQNNARPSKYGAFSVSANDDYAIFDITGKVIRAEKAGNRNFVVDVFEKETSGAMDILVRSQHIQVCGNGSGARGAIGSRVVNGDGNTVVTLAVVNNIKNFELGSSLVAVDPAAPLGAVRAAGVAEVVHTDLDSGTFTVLGDVTATWVAGDLVFVDGDAADADPDAIRPLMGMEGWIPPNAPLSGDPLFFGVNRSRAVQHYAGWRSDATTLGTTTIARTVLKSMAKMDRAGLPRRMMPTMLIMNGEDFTDLSDELGGNVQDVERQGQDVDVFYTGFKIKTAVGSLDVFIEPQWTRQRCMAIDPKSWTYHTIGSQPAVADEDGNRFRAHPTADGFQGRLVVHPELSCDAPISNMNITLP